MDTYMHKFHIKLRKNKTNQNPDWAYDKQYTKLKVIRFFLVSFSVVILIITVFGLFSIYQSMSSAIEQAENAIYMKAEIVDETINFNKYDAVKANLEMKNGTSTLTNIVDPFNIASSTEGTNTVAKEKI